MPDTFHRPAQAKQLILWNLFIYCSPARTDCRRTGRGRNVVRGSQRADMACNAALAQPALSAADQHKRPVRCASLIRSRAPDCAAWLANPEAEAAWSRASSAGSADAIPSQDEYPLATPDSWADFDANCKQLAHCLRLCSAQIFSQLRYRKLLRSPFEDRGSFPSELVGVGSHFKRKMAAGLSGKSGWNDREKVAVVRLLIAHEHADLYAQIGFLLKVRDALNFPLRAILRSVHALTCIVLLANGLQAQCHSAVSGGAAGVGERLQPTKCHCALHLQP